MATKKPTTKKTKAATKISHRKPRPSRAKAKTFVEKPMFVEKPQVKEHPVKEVGKILKGGSKEVESAKLLAQRHQGVLDGAIVLFLVATICALGSAILDGPTFWNITTAVSCIIAGVATADAADRNAKKL